jgi:hypothetical protein
LIGSGGKTAETFEAWKVVPLSLEYVLVPVPPVAVTVISPSVAVAQLNQPLYKVFTATNSTGL